jgi:hypothetical protein
MVAIEMTGPTRHAGTMTTALRLETEVTVITRQAMAHALPFWVLDPYRWLIACRAREAMSAGSVVVPLGPLMPSLKIIRKTHAGKDVVQLNLGLRLALFLPRIWIPAAWVGADRDVARVLGNALRPFIWWRVFRTFARELVMQLTLAVFSTALTGIRLALRRTPAMLAILIFLFITADAWRFADATSKWIYLLALLALLGISAAFVAHEAGDEARIIGADPHTVETPAFLTPEALALATAGVRFDGSRPPRSARINLRLVLVLMMMSRAIGVGLWVGVAFLAFAVLTVDRQLSMTLLQHAPHALASFTVGGHGFVVTIEAIRLAALLGSIATLYFVSVALQEGATRREFFPQITTLSKTIIAAGYARGAVLAWRVDSTLI